MSRSATSRHAEGIALVEVIIFMVVVGLAAGSILTVFTRTNRDSADMVVKRQALSIAEAVLNEVLAAPFTSCDLSDANFAGPGPCTLPENWPGGPEAGEQRLGPNYFDHINDYRGFSMGPGIFNRKGDAVPGLDAYSVSVDVSPIAAAWNGVNANDMAIVTVTVTTGSRLMPGSVVLQGLRARYAPTTKPS